LVIVETDFLVALSSKGDRHHAEVRRLLEELNGVFLSPYSLVELDLLITSGVLRVRPVAFYGALSRVLPYYGVTVIRPKPSHLAKAWELRSGYDLSFFDSLHAAVAIEEGEALVSYDRKYSDIEELTYIYPTDLLARRP